MDAQAAADGVPGPIGAPHERHRPERSLLYQLIATHYPRFLEHLAAEGRTLPRFVQREFEDYLKCGRLEHGFLRVRCEACHAEKLVAFSCKRRGFCPSCGARRMTESAALLVDEVLPQVPIRQWVLSVPYPLRFLFAVNPQALGAALQVTHRTIARYLVHKAGLKQRQAQAGSVTLIQRFGSALNLNVHFHMLMPDGVYLNAPSEPAFRRVEPPTPAELQALVQRISERIGRQLQRQGLLARDLESSHLLLEPAEDGDALPDIQGHSITYRIAVGPHKGRKAFMLQSLLPFGQQSGREAAQASGFSLHGGIAAEAEERAKLERLCRYITRPAVAIERLSLTPQGNIRYLLKTPYRDGTTQVVFEPLDFLSRLAALVPAPGVNLTRYHGVFAPNHRLRAAIVPARRGRCASEGTAVPVPAHAAMTWAQRLKRVFGIDVQTCEHCGGALKIIASIEDPTIIAKILTHLGIDNDLSDSTSASARAPPSPSLALFD